MFSKQNEKRFATLRKMKQVAKMLKECEDNADIHVDKSILEIA